MAEPATTTTQRHLVVAWVSATARRLVHPAFGGVAAVGGAMIFAAIGWTAVGVVLRSDPDTIVRYWLWHIAAAALLPVGLGVLSVQLTHQGGYGVGAERAWLVWAQACAALAPLTGLLLMAARPLLFRGYDVHDRWGVPVLLAGGFALACAVTAGVRQVRRIPPGRRAEVTRLMAGVATASTGLAAIGLTALFLPAPLPCCHW